MKDVFLEVYKSLSSELDFKVAWFDLLMINDYSFMEFVRFSCIFLYVSYNPMPWGRRKNTMTPELLWTKGNIIMITIIMIIYLFIFFAQVGMALILLYLLLLCIGTKCTCLICKND